jgi:N-acetylmuramoyl-L-alanine amidase
MQRLRRLLIILLAPLLLCQAAWADPAILDIRLGQHPNSTRIVVALSEPVAYRVGLLAGPPRLYIELPQSDWRGPRLPRVLGQVTSLAMSSKDGITRLTVGLRGNAKITNVALILGAVDGESRRLVVDLAPAAASDFSAAVMGAPIDSNPPLVVASLASDQPSTPPVPAANVASAAPVVAPAPLALSPVVAPAPAAPAAPAQQQASYPRGVPTLRPGSEIVTFPIASAATSPVAAPTPVQPPQVPLIVPAVATSIAPAPTLIAATATTGASNSDGATSAPMPSAPVPSAPMPSALGQSALLGTPPGVPMLRPSLEGLPLVYIDPGHGGPDPGTIGHDGTYEKNVTLAVAKELERQLLATGRYRVKLTRENDTYVPLRERFWMARADHADIFISLHADSSFVGDPRGLSVYTLSETSSDAEAAALATKENKSDLIAGVDLSKQSTAVTSILIDLAQRETKNLSAHFAELLVNELGKVTTLLPNTHRFAGFAVLKAPDIASVLIEMGYLSNVQDEGLLLSAPHRAKLAGAMLRAIDGYFTVTVASGKS